MYIYNLSYEKLGIIVHCLKNVNNEFYENMYTFSDAENMLN